MKTPLGLILFFLGFISPVAAWDDLGHMVTGAIAYDQLTPQVREKVNALLTLHPQYAVWVADVPEQEKQRIAFLRASRWADDIKSDSSYESDGSHDGNRPSGRKAARNIGYADKLRHKYWHFIDLPFSPDNTALLDPPVPNAKTQIALFRAALKSAAASDDLKSYDLVWLIHLVADVHQPLHATSRFDKAHVAGDDGGNGVLVCTAPCERHQKLHAFWDHIFGMTADAAGAIEKARQLPAANSQLASISDEDVWIRESFEAAQTHAYASPIAVGVGPYEVTDAYRTAAQEVAMQRVALAAARLANLLNDALR
jgi:hypothetical protein